MQSFTVQMDEKLHKKLRKAAFVLNKSMAEVVREAVEKYLKENKRHTSEKNEK